MLNESITTDRLVLQPVRESDAPALQPLLTWNVAQWLSSVAWPNGVDDTRAYLSRATGINARGEGAHYTVQDEEGPCGVISLQPEDGALTLGYWIGERCWGKGLMTEAAAAFVDAFFSRHDVVHIVSSVFAGNDASIRVQEKLGFVIVGETVRYSKARQCTLPRFDTVLGRARRVQTLAA